MKKTLLITALAVLCGFSYLALKKAPADTPTPKNVQTESTQPKQTPTEQVCKVETTKTERELNQFGLTLNGAKPINVR